MKRVIILGIIFIFLFISVSFAETSIKAEVDKNTLTTDEALTYKIIITSSEKQIPEPRVPKFEGFNVVSSASSSTVSFTEGNVKTILVYAFILAPAAAGKFKIEPSRIKVAGNAYFSQEFEIQVTQGKVQPKALPEQKPSPPEKTLPKSEEPQVTL